MNNLQHKHVWCLCWTLPETDASDALTLSLSKTFFGLIVKLLWTKENATQKRL